MDSLRDQRPPTSRVRVERARSSQDRRARRVLVTAFFLGFGLLFEHELHSLELQLGTEFGFLTQPVAFNDPYAFARGVGAFAELSSAGRRMRYRVEATQYSFDSMRDAFDESSMTVLGAALGYDLYHAGDSDFGWRVSPFVAYRHYIRRVRFADASATASRPMTAVGLYVGASRARAPSTGLALEQVVAWDNTPVFMVAFRVSIGWSFDGDTAELSE